MVAPGWIEYFVRRFETIGLPYMVTGSVASAIYGEPRLVLDVDLVVELGVERAEQVLDAFPETEFYRPPHATGCRERRMAAWGGASSGSGEPMSRRPRRREATPVALMILSKRMADHRPHDMIYDPVDNALDADA